MKKQIPFYTFEAFNEKRYHFKVLEESYLKYIITLSLDLDSIQSSIEENHNFDFAFIVLSEQNKININELRQKGLIVDSIPDDSIEIDIGFFWEFLETRYCLEFFNNALQVNFYEEIYN
ncbi:hypothetical protein BCT63_13310 [Vibrio kanaloae]|uniref:hypothetical protein n=1 Tax=Vibrio kanaloae TaxID=170673 RepID=UPI000C85D620|nr:hypothetical protein [Vibrio kanaloae]PMM03778.1 hypothetical protein BCT63_13310 [Vibrio kanaloae]